MTRGSEAKPGDAFWNTLVEAAPVPIASLDAVRDAENAIVDFAFHYLNPPARRQAWPSCGDSEPGRLLGDRAHDRGEASLLVEALGKVVEEGRTWTARALALAVSGRDEARRTRRFDLFASKLGDGVILVWWSAPREAPPGGEGEEETPAGEAEGVRWLATLRHEIANSVHTMIGFCELLRSGVSGPLGERQRRQIDQVLRACRHLISLVDESLASFGRGGAEAPLRAGDVDLRELAGDVVAAMTPEAERRGLGLDLRCPDPGPEVRTDGDKVRQILTNLVSNALKYTEEGRVVVRVDSSGDDWIRIRVRDSGVGIPEEKKEEIFEPYVRLQAVGDRGGSGLGLAVCRQLARRLGGEVELEESSPSAGSVFTFRLPRTGAVSESSSNDSGAA